MGLKPCSHVTFALNETSRMGSTATSDGVHTLRLHEMVKSNEKKQTQTLHVNVPLRFERETKPFLWS